MNIKTNYKNLRVELILDQIIICTISRPKQLNALNSEVLSELHQFIDDISSLLPNQKLAGIIMTGEGEKAFIAGADILEMSKLLPEEAKKFGALGQELTLKMESLSLPIIACVNGFALGGGCEVAMACDFIYATANSSFGQPEVKLGLIPGFGGTQRLARYLGRGLARELLYTGENFSSKVALAHGLVNSIYNSKNEMLDEAKKILLKINKNSMIAVSETKSATNSGIDQSLNMGLKIELELFSKSFSTEDAKEGMNAFLAKRKAIFQSK